MDRALWLLLRLRLGGWLRRLWRALGSVRGVLLTLFGVGIFAAWLLPMLLLQTPVQPHLQGVRRFGALGLLVACVLNVLLSSNERAITFSPAEVNLLFPAPLSRRQLLAYKIVGSLGGILVTALLLTLFTAQHTASLLCGFVGLMLILVFLLLFSMVLALLASAIGARAYNLRRRVVLAVVLLFLATAAWQAGGRDLLRQNWLEALQELERTPVMEAVLTPVSWFIKAATAEHVWPDLVQWSALCLAVLAALLLLVFALDAQYLEVAASASERAYARLQQIRRGTAPMVVVSGSGPRLSLPALPRWGGVGPLLWRQLQTALRSLWALVLVLLMFGIGLGPVLAVSSELGQTALGSATTAGLCIMALFVPPMLPFDFRGDIDRMDLLKTLPLPGWSVVVGQMLAPVLVISLLQCMLLIAILAWSSWEPVLLAVMVLLLPINFLLFALENLFFLWFPTRQLNAGPGDFQALSRQMLNWLAKILVLGVVSLFAGAAGVLAYWLAGQSWIAGGVVVWLVVTAAAAGLVPLVARAFAQFDVARDTPP